MVWPSATATLAGAFTDLRGQSSARPDLYDPASYGASQPFGEGTHNAGDPGILYDSLHHAGGENVVAYSTHAIQDVVQTDHYELSVTAATSRIKARRLTVSAGVRTPCLAHARGLRTALSSIIIIMRIEIWLTEK